MKSREVAVISLLASLYVVIGYFIPYISFGYYQCRIQDALYALIPLFGLPGVMGTFLGHGIYNVYGYVIGVALGPLDLFSPLVFLPAKIILWKVGNRSNILLILALLLHVLSVGWWVGYLLKLQFGVPMFGIWGGIISVSIGEFIAEIVLGVPLYYVIKHRIKVGRH